MCKTVSQKAPSKACTPTTTNTHLSEKEKTKKHKTTNPSVENPTVKVDERGTAEWTVRDSLMVTQLAASHNCQTSSTLKTGVTDGRRSLILPSLTPPSPQEASFETLSTTATMISVLNLDKFGFKLDFFAFISVGVQKGVAERLETLKISKTASSTSNKRGGGHQLNRLENSFKFRPKQKLTSDEWPEEASFLRILIKFQLKLWIGSLGWLLMCKFTYIGLPPMAKTLVTLLPATCTNPEESTDKHT